MEGGRGDDGGHVDVGEADGRNVEYMVLYRVWVTGKGALKWEFRGEFTTQRTATTEAFNNVAITRTR